MKTTAGNVNDRHSLPKLARSLFGKLFGDQGYIWQLLFENSGSRVCSSSPKHVRA
ncbi:transposase [Nitrosomonas communis]|uniref:transposase n=1 Tax=Nitrosomonas TaxID=914 RepID=UPI00165339E5